MAEDDSKPEPYLEEKPFTYTITIERAAADLILRMVDQNEKKKGAEGWEDWQPSDVIADALQIGLQLIAHQLLGELSAGRAVVKRLVLVTPEGK